LANVQILELAIKNGFYSHAKMLVNVLDKWIYAEDQGPRQNIRESMIQSLGEVMNSIFQDKEKDDVKIWLDKYEVLKKVLKKKKV
jgi:hypothetical protein